MGDKKMPISMNTTSSQRMAYRLGDFGLEIRKRLAKASERLSLIFSAIIIKRIEQQELKDHEAHQEELGYEATKRKLLVALHDKIAERQANGK
jgi:hypothetical protein